MEIIADTNGSRVRRNRQIVDTFMCHSSSEFMWELSKAIGTQQDVSPITMVHEKCSLFVLVLKRGRTPRYQLTIVQQRNGQKDSTVIPYKTDVQIVHSKIHTSYSPDCPLQQCIQMVPSFQGSCSATPISMLKTKMEYINIIICNICICLFFERTTH